MNFIQTIPVKTNPALAAIYQQPFVESKLVGWFAGWEYDRHTGRYIDGTESRNLTWFANGVQFLNGQQLPYPDTLDQFIQHCTMMDIALVWQEDMANQLWASIWNQPDGQASDLRYGIKF